VAALCVGMVWVLVSAAAASVAPSRANDGTEFHQTNLVSDLSTVGAMLVDPALKNPWGLALSASPPLWVANNASATATVYSVGAGAATVTAVPLAVAIPGGRASTGDPPSPTVQVLNATAAFGGARFIFSSESGQITTWKPTDGRAAELKFSSPTAVYKGLAIASSGDGTFLYASNFHDATVDVFDTNFQNVTLAGDFSDPSLPGGYAPFGIQELHGLIYVTYAKQNDAKHDDVAGRGHGFIDVYTVDGFFVKRLASRGSLDSPWGMVTAPASFGDFAGKLLVGDFGDGRINVFDPFSGRFLAQLRNEAHRPIAIDGLWGLKVGTAATAGTGTVLFSAGINGEADGLLGALTAAG
jgi:uncharacterized protein (TIGR03118 family)